MIGNMLKYMRITRNFKQDEIAKKINIKSNALSQYETSSRQPTFETIEKIADLCDFDIYFIDRKTKEKFKIKDFNRKIS
jgi:transcriptional regulator with XRE-family HTH domain